jgi:hypothetical protein
MTGNSTAPEAGQEIYSLFAPSRVDDNSTHAYRLLIGLLGLLMPGILLLLNGVRPTVGIWRWKLLGSVSEYYYTGGQAAFVGILVSLALYLFTYKGFKNKHQKLDRGAAIVAGITAILVTLFPTQATNNLLSVPSWWKPCMYWIHNISAVVLFLTFAFFSLVLFRKSDKKILEWDKQFRNWIYILCGVGILVCLCWALVLYFCFKSKSEFWPEALAIIFFAVSWLVKGRVDKFLKASVRRILY